MQLPAGLCAGVPGEMKREKKRVGERECLDIVDDNRGEGICGRVVIKW